MKTHIDSEVQGPGRRFWFKRTADRKAFADAKRSAGYAVVEASSDGDGRAAAGGGARGGSVWVSFSKKRSHAVDLVVRGGVDPWSMS